MTDLTKKWRKGELPIGWYYTKLWKGCNVIDKFIGNQFLRYDDSDIVEVITPVPSYEEWKKLKDTLYKCREKLDRLDYGCEVWAGELTGFIEEIDNAIGEKK